MCDFISNRRYLCDGRLQALLCVGAATKRLADIRPDVVRKQQGRQLSQVEIVDTRHWIGCARTGAESSPQHLALVLRKGSLDSGGRPFTVAGEIHGSNEGAKRPFSVGNSFPNGGRTRQEPGWWQAIIL